MLFIDVEFGLQKDGQKLQTRKSTNVQQLKKRLKYSHMKAKEVALKQ